MHDIETNTANEAFAHMWQAAGMHLNKQIDGGIPAWIKANLEPPFLEHLSFRLGNQLFFIHVIDVDQQVVGPGSWNGLQMISEACGGHACLMPMRKDAIHGWHPVATGWGLINPVDGEEIAPVDLVTDENIVMTDWELQDFAVQVVRKDLEGQGYSIMSSQGNPSVHPSLWFVGDSKGPEWVVIRFGKYPNKTATLPSNLSEISSSCARQSPIGHFASVVFANHDEAFDPMATEALLPIYRGHGVYINYKGLEPITSPSMM